MPPLEVTVRPPSRRRSEYDAIKHRLDAQLRKAAEIEAGAEKNPGTAESRLYLADQMRNAAERKYYEEFTGMIDRRISGDSRDSGSGTAYLKRNDGGIARKTRMF
jgi:hypothetical protein